MADGAAVAVAESGKTTQRIQIKNKKAKAPVMEKNDIKSLQVILKLMAHQAVAETEVKDIRKQEGLILTQYEGFVNLLVDAAQDNGRGNATFSKEFFTSLHVVPSLIPAKGILMSFAGTTFNGAQLLRQAKDHKSAFINDYHHIWMTKILNKDGDFYSGKDEAWGVETLMKILYNNQLIVMNDEDELVAAEGVVVPCDWKPKSIVWMAYLYLGPACTLFGRRGPIAFLSEKPTSAPAVDEDDAVDDSAQRGRSAQRSQAMRAQSVDAFQGEMQWSKASEGQSALLLGNLQAESSDIDGELNGLKAILEAQTILMKVEADEDFKKNIVSQISETIKDIKALGVRRAPIQAALAAQRQALNQASSWAGTPASATHVVKVENVSGPSSNSKNRGGATVKPPKPPIIGVSGKERQEKLLYACHACSEKIYNGDAFAACPIDACHLKFCSSCNDVGLEKHLREHAESDDDNDGEEEQRPNKLAKYE